MTNKRCLFLVIPLTITILFYNNCSPTFESSRITKSLTQSSIDEFETGFSVLFKNSYVVDKAKFKSSSSDELSFSCNSPQSDTIVNHASKLSIEEINNTVKNILDVEIQAEDHYPKQKAELVFQGANVFTVEQTLYASLNSLASEVADRFVQSLALGSNEIWSCDFSQECTEKIIRDLPRYLWRQVMNVEDSSRINDYLSLSENSNLGKIKALIKFLIISPQFITKNYQQKNASELSIIDLNEYSNRVSFFLKSSSPSIDFLDKLDADQFKSTDEILTYMFNGLREPGQLRTFITNFYGEWLGIKSHLEDKNSFGSETVDKIAADQLNHLVQLFENDAPLSSLLDGR